MFTEDLSPFFDTTFGHAVLGTIKTAAGATVRTAGVIWSNTLQALGIFDQEIETSQPSLVLQTADLAGVVLNQHTITIDGTQYRIVDRKDDGTGVSSLKVRK